MTFIHFYGYKFGKKLISIVILLLQAVVADQLLALPEGQEVTVIQPWTQLVMMVGLWRNAKLCQIKNR